MGTALVLTAGAAAAPSSPPPPIVVGPQAPPLERTAAGQLAVHLHRLTGSRPKIQTTVPAGTCILVGSPRTNPALAAAAQGSWPKLSEQGTCFRSTGPRLLVGGGSPAATLWAVHDLAARWGVRTFLDRDRWPARPVRPTLTGWNVVREPAVETRGWAMMGGETGSDGWGASDRARLLDQLARLKFNALLLRLGGRQPYLATGQAGAPAGELRLFESRYPIDGETPGRDVFRGAPEYRNPDLPTAPAAVQLAAGRQLALSTLRAARALGMRTHVVLAPLDLPDATANWALARGWDHPDLQQFIRERITAYSDAYPDADTFCLSPDADPRWAAGWDRLVATGKITPKAAEMIGNDGDRRAQLVALTILHQAVRSSLLNPRFGANPRWVIQDGAVLAAGREMRMVGPGALTGSPTSGDGWLQNGTLIPEGLAAGPPGVREVFLTHRLPAGQTPQAQFLGRAVQDPPTPPAALARLLSGIGDGGVLDRTRRALTLLSDLPALPGSAAPAANFLRSVGGMSAEDAGRIAQLKAACLAATDEMYRANQRTDLTLHSWTRYYAKRLEFASGYCTTVELARGGAQKESQGQNREAAAGYEQAAEALHTAMGSMAEVAADPSDRGLMAVVTERVYRPLLRAAERLAGRR